MFFVTYSGYFFNSFWIVYINVLDYLTIIYIDHSLKPPNVEKTKKFDISARTHRKTEN